MRRWRACLALVLALAGASAAHRCGVGALRMQVEGATGRATSTRRFLRHPQGRVATAESPEDNGAVVDESTTFVTVSQLNEVCLQQFRCHSVADDPAPDVDPFALTRDEVCSLNEAVCTEVEGVDEVLTASAQHFFGAGNTREGKRVRPVIVNLMGRVRAAPPRHMAQR